MEIERKWLVGTPPSGLPTGTTIRQGYVAATPSGDELRVRDKGGTRLVTVKHGRGLVRGEVETEVSDELFAALWALTDGRRVEKTRAVLPLDDGLEAEVDVFTGDLEGLMVVEVEFPDVAAAEAFVAPGWFGADVTDDDRYRNQRLALDGRPG